MKYTCKNTYGDGTVEYKEYEIAEPGDDVLSEEEALNVLLGGDEE